jgi:hypothetical protein
MKHILLAVGSLVVAFAVFVSVAVASPTDAFFGYAWSPNVGWIRMNNCESPTNCVSGGPTHEGSSGAIGYGVTIAPSGATRAISGYAWSSNIGWITFNTDSSSQGSDPVLNCPSSIGGGNTRCGPYIDWGTSGLGAGHRVVGWARACSVYIDCADPSRGLVENYERGGWDGWIALHDTNISDSAFFGVTVDTLSGVMSGYGWGSDVVGWVDFSGVSIYTPDECPVPPSVPLPGGFTNNCQTCNPGDPCFCAKYPADPSCVGGPLCSDGTPAPNGDIRMCAICDIVDINGNPQCNQTCPDGSAAPNGDITKCPDCPRGTPCWCTTHASDPICTNNPQCSDGIDNDGDGSIDYSGGDPGCDDGSDDDETDANCSVVGSPCWCAGNGNPPAQCGGGPVGPNCTNIPNDPVTGADIVPITFPPYRQLADGRCACVVGYVLNSNFLCVRPVYTEPNQ